MDDIPPIEYAEIIDDHEDKDYYFENLDEDDFYNEDELNDFQSEIKTSDDYLLDPRYSIILKFKYKLTKIKDDEKILSYLERKKLRLMGLHASGDPIYCDSDVYNKFMEVVDQEINSITSKMYNVVKATYSAQKNAINIPTNDDFDESAIEWKHAPLDLVELHYSLFWGKKRNYNKRTVIKEFRQLEKFFHHPEIDNPSNKQQAIRVQSLEHTKEIACSLNTYFKNHNYNFDEEELVKSKSPRDHYIFDSNFDWVGGDEEFVEFFLALKMSKSFSLTRPVEPFWQFCSFFHKSIPEPNRILSDIVKKYMNKQNCFLDIFLNTCLNLKSK